MNKEFGTYIISNPKICGGELTFKGTRILVKGVLQQLERGLAFEEIIEEWHNKINKEAILEAIQLANKAFFKYQKELVA